MLLCAINFPFRVRRLLDNPQHSRYLHVAILLACSFPPAIAVGCSFALGDYITQFPPVYCTTEDPDASYYVLILPLSIVCAAGVSCLVLILWSLVRHRRARVSNGEVYRILPSKRPPPFFDAPMIRAYNALYQVNARPRFLAREFQAPVGA